MWSSVIYLPAVEDVHERDGEHVRLLGASKVGDVSVQRNALRRSQLSFSTQHGSPATHLLSSTSLGNSQADTEDGVGAKLGLVGGAIEAVEELIDLGLVLDVDALLDQGRGNDSVDILDGLGDTLATPLGLVAVTELASLVLSCFTRLLLASSR